MASPEHESTASLDDDLDTLFDRMSTVRAFTGLDERMLSTAYFLHDFEDLPVRCRADFQPPPASPSPEVADAIRICDRLDRGPYAEFDPRYRQRPARLGAFGWAGFFLGVVSWIRRAVPNPLLLGHCRDFCEDPYESYFRHGDRWQAGSVLGQAIIQYPGQWVAVIVDQCGDEQASTPVQYILRSEILACILLLRRQWDSDGPIKGTVITFTSNRVRIVEALYLPSSPTVTLTIRASIRLGDGAADYSSVDARTVTRWMICPSDSQPLPAAGQRMVPDDGPADRPDGSVRERLDVDWFCLHGI